jgi:hypothetical protein
MTTGNTSGYNTGVTVVTAQPRRRPPAAVARRPVVVLSLSELHGPQTGIIRPPRDIWWSGEPAVNLDDLGQAVVFYDQLLDNGTREDIATWASGGKLIELWPTMGGRSAVRKGWEDVNPQLAEAAGKAGHAAVAA